MHAVEQGVDLRGVSLLAFGGAGPVHACGVAELLDSDRVIFPVNASVLSAFGTLVSPVRIDLARSMPRRLDQIDVTERTACSTCCATRAGGCSLPRVRRPMRSASVTGVDARYAGQGNEVTVWIGEGDSWPIDDAGVLAAFEAEYRTDLRTHDSRRRRRDRHVAPRGVGRCRAGRARPGADGSGGEPPSPDGRSCSAGQRTDRHPGVPAQANSALVTPSTVPPIVEERETTAVIRPGWNVEVGTDGSLIATRNAVEQEPCCMTTTDRPPPRRIGTRRSATASTRSNSRSAGRA